MMEGLERVWVVIPSFNAAERIARCLDSLGRQTYAAWQAVVVDDGSTDRTAEIIRAYAANDTRYTPLQMPHGGVAAARNAALSAIEPEKPGLITFLDADDFLDADALEAMAEAMLRTGADIVQCKYYSEFSGGYCRVPKDLFPDGSVFEADQFPSTVYWKMITGIHMNHVCVKLFRGHVLDGLRFDETMATAEDLLLNLEAFPRAKRYAYMARPLYHYIRDSAGGLTNAGIAWHRKLSCNWKVSKRILACLPAWHKNTIVYRCLTVLRPFTIFVQKVVRTLRGKLHAPIRPASG